jgi:hypothetical protein
MSQIPQPAPKEQQLLRHARREGLLLMAVWALALIWSVGYSAMFGYEHSADDIQSIQSIITNLNQNIPDWAERVDSEETEKQDEIKLILGMPDWVFWGIAVPWVICFLFTTWFCFFFMADDDLGRDVDEGPGHDA